MAKPLGSFIISPMVTLPPFKFKIITSLSLYADFCTFVHLLKGMITESYTHFPQGFPQDKPLITLTFAIFRPVFPIKNSGFSTLFHKNFSAKIR